MNRTPSIARKKISILGIEMPELPEEALKKSIKLSSNVPTTVLTNAKVADKIISRNGKQFQYSDDTFVIGVDSDAEMVAAPNEPQMVLPSFSVKMPSSTTNIKTTILKNSDININESTQLNEPEFGTAIDTDEDDDTKVIDDDVEDSYDLALTIKLYEEDNNDIIKIADYNTNVITFYIKLNEIDISVYTPHMVNKHWDGIKHLTPNATFELPESIAIDSVSKLNDVVSELILIQLKDRIFGVYYIRDNELTDDQLAKMSYLMEMYVNKTPLSSLDTTISDASLMLSMEDTLKLINDMNDQSNQIDDDSYQEDEELLLVADQEESLLIDEGEEVVEETVAQLFDDDTFMNIIDQVAANSIEVNDDNNNINAFPVIRKNE